MPSTTFDYDRAAFGASSSFLLIVLVLQLALLHVRLYLKAHHRHVTAFTRAVTIITIALVVILAVMLVIPLAFGEFVAYPDPYWRWVVALAILARRRHGARSRSSTRSSRRRAARGRGRRADTPRAVSAVADLRRRRDAASRHARRLARLERLLHGLSVDGRRRRSRPTGAVAPVAASRRRHRTTPAQPDAAAADATTPPRRALARAAPSSGIRGLPASAAASAAPLSASPEPLSAPRISSAAIAAL